MMRGLAEILYAKAGEGARTDLRALRVSLAYSLEASNLRPFDFESRYLSGRSLTRLGRPADGGVLIEEAKSVRFSPIIRPDAGGGIKFKPHKPEILRAPARTAEPR